MPKLVILNGPCGIGKSTAARNLHKTMPLSYLVDVDAIVRNISHYRAYREERWELGEAVAFATVDAVLSVGRDAIIEKMIFSEDVLDTYREIGKKHGAEIFEIILWAPKSFVMERAENRGWREGGLLTPEKCEDFWFKIDALKSNRPNARFIDVEQLNEQEVLIAIQSLIHGRTFHEPT